MSQRSNMSSSSIFLSLKKSSNAFFCLPYIHLWNVSEDQHITVIGLFCHQNTSFLTSIYHHRRFILSSKKSSKCIYFDFRTCSSGLECLVVGRRYIDHHEWVYSPSSSMCRKWNKQCTAWMKCLFFIWVHM